MVTATLLLVIQRHFTRRYDYPCSRSPGAGSGCRHAGIMPPSMRVSPVHSVDEFMAKVSDMRSKLDVERTRKVKDEGEDDE